MQHIYAPWRSKYFEQDETGCPFCAIALNMQDDEENFVFYRDEICYGVMNRYPYTPGHFLLIPYQHVDSPSALCAETFAHLSMLAHKSIMLLEEFGAQGVNTGMNIRAVAGAGIPEHLHWHFVPRFTSDTNFFTTISECRTYGVDFKAIYQRIKLLATTHLAQNPESSN